MPEDLCGAPTKQGGTCRWPRSECRWHDHNDAAHAEPADPALDPPSAAIDRRDLRGLGWWIIEQTVRGELAANRGSVISTVMRTLATLGPEPLGEDDALREIELRGRLMNGIPPETEEEWALAASIFDDDALAEFRRWPSLELHRSD